MNTVIFKNYFKVALRNIMRRKLYSAINALGLSIAVAFTIFVFLFVRDEANFDSFHANGSDIYRIDNKRFDFPSFKNGDKEPFTSTADQPAPLGEALLEELPEVRAMTRYVRRSDGILRYGEKVFREPTVAVDSSFFDMFSFELFAGNASKLFRGESEIVLTRRLAEKYFGEQDPLGKVMTLEIGGSTLSLTVTGVMEDVPANSSLSVQALVPVKVLPGLSREWNNRSVVTFVQLHPGSDVQAFEKNLNGLYIRHVPDNKEFRDREKIPEEYRMNQLYATNLRDIHYDTRIKWEKSSDPIYSDILIGIAILIVLVACVNYISLTLTGSAHRVKEVGVRKISGAVRRELIFQFNIESIVVALISLFIALIMVFLLLPSFNSFTSKEIALTSFDWTQLLALALVVAIASGIVSGWYPALHLSGLKPVSMLKGGFTFRANPWFARPFLVVQFALSAFLGMSAVVMYRQMEFVTTKDLGYDPEHIVIIPLYQEDATSASRFLEAFQSKLEPESDIISIAGTSIAFTNGTMSMGFRHNEEFKMTSGYVVDANYISTLGIELVNGRTFDARNPADFENTIMVNEAFVRDMKWEDPLQQHVKLRLDEEGLGSRIIGVVKDHHFLSLEQSIGPMFLTMDHKFGKFQYGLVKVSSEYLPQTIGKLENAFKALSPDNPFEYEFLDENVRLQYQLYERWMNVMGLSTFLAILISCSGVFGLSGLNIVNRTREIGLRQVLGARVKDIFVLMNKQYVWLCLMAYALALFPAWYAVNQWLSNFQFAITSTLIWFCGSAALGLVIVLTTTTYHVLKAASVNPINSLKHE